MHELDGKVTEKLEMVPFLAIILIFISSNISLKKALNVSLFFECVVLRANRVCFKANLILAFPMKFRGNIEDDGWMFCRESTQRLDMFE